MAIGRHAAAAGSQVVVSILVVVRARPVGVNLQPVADPMPVGNSVHVGLIVHAATARQISVRGLRVGRKSEAIGVLAGIAWRAVGARPADREAVVFSDGLCDREPATQPLPAQAPRIAEKSVSAPSR